MLYIRAYPRLRNNYHIKLNSLHSSQSALQSKQPFSNTYSRHLQSFKHRDPEYIYIPSILSTKLHKPYNSHFQISYKPLSNTSFKNTFQQPHRQQPPQSTIMCMRVVEIYSVCKCVYFTHGIDQCSAYGRHAVEDRIVLVGHSCPSHSGTGFQYSTSSRIQSQIAGVIPDFSYNYNAYT